LELDDEMTIQSILAQLEATFGKPTSTITFNYNAIFTSSFSAMDTPETLFRRIEECQEIAVLGGIPYSVQQIVGNTMFLFLQLGIFPHREFETWDAIPNKTWPALKTFVQQAYQRKLIATGLRNTMGKMGYAPTTNVFHAFEDDDESSVETTVTQVAATATTTGSTLGATYQASTVPSELATAIQTIAANQQALYQHVAPLTQQMAAMTYQHGTQAHLFPYQTTPPIINTGIPQVPTYVGYQAGGTGTGYGGGYGGGFQQGRGSGRTVHLDAGAEDAQLLPIMSHMVEDMVDLTSLLLTTLLTRSKSITTGMYVTRADSTSR
jgi:hypothetical protein